MHPHKGIDTSQPAHCNGVQRRYIQYLLPDDKVLDLSKFKALADDRLKVAQMVEIVSDWVEIIVNQHFHLFPQ